MTVGTSSTRMIAEKGFAMGSDFGAPTDGGALLVNICARYSLARFYATLHVSLITEGSRVFRWPKSDEGFAGASILP
jgi:hypothetical protein